MEQLYSEAAGKFLADRFVSGTCPKCGYEVGCAGGRGGKGRGGSGGRAFYEGGWRRGQGFWVGGGGLAVQTPTHALKSLYKPKTKPPIPQTDTQSSPKDARGDQCDSCGSLMNPTELINPRCKITGTKPVVRSTRHVFLDLPKLTGALQQYVDSTSQDGGWSANCLQVGLGVGWGVQGGGGVMRRVACGC